MKAITPDNIFDGSVAVKALVDSRMKFANGKIIQGLVSLIFVVVILRKLPTGMYLTLILGTAAFYFWWCLWPYWTLMRSLYNLVYQANFTEEELQLFVYPPNKVFAGLGFKPRKIVIPKAEKNVYFTNESVFGNNRNSDVVYITAADKKLMVVIDLFPNGDLLKKLLLN